MPKDNSDWLSPEAEAVLKASRKDISPCEPKYGRMPSDQFLEHVRADGCQKCRAWLLQLDKEQKMMAYLRDHMN